MGKGYNVHCLAEYYSTTSSVFSRATPDSCHGQWKTLPTLCRGAEIRIDGDWRGVEFGYSFWFFFHLPGFELNLNSIWTEERNKESSTNEWLKCPKGIKWAGVTCPGSLLKQLLGGADTSLHLLWKILIYFLPEVLTSFTCT